MSIKEFDKLFGLSSTIEEEKIKFINRIENTLFSFFARNFELQDKQRLFKFVCNQLGLDADNLIRQNSLLSTMIPTFDSLSNKDFIQTLRITVAIYSGFSEREDIQQFITKVVAETLDKSTLNLGIKWTDGIFYPTGDKLLDKELIDTAVSLLDQYPNEKKDLKNALDNYNSKSLYGVVENCYIAVEGISRNLLNNNRTLDKNKEDLLRLLKFSKYWDKIFLNYLSYAHEYRRHAGENRHDLKPEEVEGFLYLTCLIIRSTLRAFDDKK
jgi:hypothetical protein